MAGKKRNSRKVRVDFRQNRTPRSRTDDWTQKYHADEHGLADAHQSESVRAKGDLSRKRTILVGEDETPLVDESLWRRGVVTCIRGPICQVDGGDGRTIDCTVRRVLKTLLIEQRSSVTVGDAVWFSELAAAADGAPVGVIERVEPRRTLLSRGARIGHDQRRGGHRRQHLIAANVDQLVIIGSAARPALKPHLVDRFLVAAGKGQLRPVICVNKVDLLDAPLAEQEVVAAAPPPDAEFEDDEYEYEYVDEVQSPLEELIEQFRALGYRVLLTSAPRGDGLDALREELRGRISVFSGQSGVGKSSLLNALQPGLRLEVSEVSDENEKGRHTTTHARLLPLSFGGYVVDTPGIRSFDLWQVEPGELEAYFVEFLPYIPQCRFNDCHHTDEQGCAVRAAADEGAIAARRYSSYLKMLDEVRRQ